jgi:hypothetical protein
MILVVNMIPKSLSGETHQDSEPNLGVNSANPQQMAASAFTPDYGSTSNAPIYVSIDGGNTWTLNAIVPGADAFVAPGTQNTGTKDISLRFDGSGKFLFGSDLRGDSATRTLNILRTADATSASAMAILGTPRDGPDQPWIEAATVPSGSDKDKDRVYVGLNDAGLAGGQTATLEMSLDAGAATPPFTAPVRLEQRATGTGGQDGFQIRLAVHSDGTVYAAFYGWRARTPAGSVTTDVVVTRDDNWGTGANPFTALTDSGDSVSGVRVIQNVTISISPAEMGQQRLGGSLSIAVDPTDSKTVYLAYGDEAGSTATLHIVRSTDKGATWSADLLTVTNAINPGIAINSNGDVGLVYQQLTGSDPSQNWETHFRQSSGGLVWSDATLAKTPAGVPARTFDPYLGDYLYLTAVGKDFCGVFCANNTPDNANFPSGVKYQRNADFTNKTLLGIDNTTAVNPSIDPFFFKVTAEAGPSPSPTPTPTPTPSPTPTPTPTPSPTPTPTPTPSPTPTPTPSPTPTPTPTPSPTPTPTPSPTPTPTPTPSPTPTPTPSPTPTPTPSPTPTPTPSPTPSPTPAPASPKRRPAAGSRGRSGPSKRKR